MGTCSTTTIEQGKALKLCDELLQTGNEPNVSLPSKWRVLTCDSHELVPVEVCVSGDECGDVNDELPKWPEMSYRPVNARHEKAVLRRERAYLRAIDGILPSPRPELLVVPSNGQLPPQ